MDMLKFLLIQLVVTIIIIIIFIIIIIQDIRCINKITERETIIETIETHKLSWEILMGEKTQRKLPKYR